jgi:hypothetical protein
MTEPLRLVKPPKPWREMTPEERTAWAESVVAAMVAAEAK